MLTELTLICENTAPAKGILGEHGLAWLIQSGDRSLLFDTGGGLTLAHNCQELKIDLERIDAVLLSHGHYDHVGGLTDVLKKNPHCPVYAHEMIEHEKFSRTHEGTCKCLSLSLLTDSMEREKWQHRFKPVSYVTELIPEIFTTGYVPRVTTFEDAGGPFFLDEKLTHADPVEDDLSIFLNTSEGLCVVLGCAHAGIINILRYIQTVRPGRPITAVFGGMHLLNAEPQRLGETIEALRGLGSPRLFPNHCTGLNAICRLREAFPEKVFTASAGMRWTFEMPAQSNYS